MISKSYNITNTIVNETKTSKIDFEKHTKKINEYVFVANV